jgi:hypothetical protein
MTNGQNIEYEVPKATSLYNKYLKVKRSNSPVEIIDFNKQFSIVLPTKEKFRDTVINQTYYELLRIFSNELDKENTLLIAEGFSFSDEHILQLTKRALKNPTLLLVVFCYSSEDHIKNELKFKDFDNVLTIFSENKKISFTEFTKFMRQIIPL